MALPREGLALTTAMGVRPGIGLALGEGDPTRAVALPRESLELRH